MSISEICKFEVKKEIDTCVEEGMSRNEAAKWLADVFAEALGRDIKPGTIRQKDLRARNDLATNVAKESNPPKKTDTYEPPAEPQTTPQDTPHSCTMSQNTANCEAVYRDISRLGIDFFKSARYTFDILKLLIGLIRTTRLVLLFGCFLTCIDVPDILRIILVREGTWSRSTY